MGSNVNVNKYTGQSASSACCPAVCSVLQQKKCSVAEILADIFVFVQSHAAKVSIIWQAIVVIGYYRYYVGGSPYWNRKYQTFVTCLVKSLNHATFHQICPKFSFHRLASSKPLHCSAYLLFSISTLQQTTQLHMSHTVSSRKTHKETSKEDIPVTQNWPLSSSWLAVISCARLPTPPP